VWKNRRGVPRDPQRLDDLIHAHLDGALTPADRAELEQQLLASPEARRRFWDETAWHGRLHEAAQLAWSAPASAAAPAAPRRRTGWWLGALGLAAAAVLALWIRPAVDSVPTGPRVTQVDGAGVVRRAGVEQPAAAGLAVQAGDEVQVAEGGALRLALADGTRLDLAGGTRLVVRDADARQLDLRAGRVTADVQPQPAGRQLVLTTPLARATVHGTVFTLAASTAATHLQVQRGMVRMAHAQQDSEVDVAGGEFALAVPGAELVAGLEPVTGRVAAATAPADRDPAAHPFAPDSPWNTAIGRERAV
jgi:ferric-dicitrate binding protein FerR (iron transport regulator)